MSDVDCATAYPVGLFPGMVCAGDLVDGGEDSCYGDSGGPLMVPDGPEWVQVGIVSTGTDCARRRFPGIYTEVASYPFVQRYLDPDSVPDRVAGLHRRAAFGAAFLDWNAPYFDGGTAILRYRIDLPGLGRSLSVPATRTDAVLRNLPAGRHLVQVRAVNAVGLERGARGVHQRLITSRAEPKARRPMSTASPFAERSEANQPSARDACTCPLRPQDKSDFGRPPWHALRHDRSFPPRPRAAARPRAAPPGGRGLRPGDATDGPRRRHRDRRWPARRPRRVPLSGRPPAPLGAQPLQRPVLRRLPDLPRHRPHRGPLPGGHDRRADRRAGRHPHAGPRWWRGPPPGPPHPEPSRLRPGHLRQRRRHRPARGRASRGGRPDGPDRPGRPVGPRHHRDRHRLGQPVGQRLQTSRWPSTRSRSRSGPTPTAPTPTGTSPTS